MKNGFSLVQFVIYLTLFLMLTMLVSSFVSALYKNSYSLARNIQQKLNLYTARDLMVKDLARASFEKKWWSATDKELIFHVADSKEDVGWIIKKNRLLRYTGSYNRALKVWRKKTVSMVTDDVKALSCVMHEHTNTPHIKYVSGKLFSRSAKDVFEFIAILQGTII